MRLLLQPYHVHGYSYIGKYISKKYSNKLQGNFFKPWIDEYASDGFDKFTDEWLAYVDKKCSNLSEEKKKINRYI